MRRTEPRTVSQRQPLGRLPLVLQIEFCKVDRRIRQIPAARLLVGLVIAEDRVCIWVIGVARIIGIPVETDIPREIVGALTFVGPDVMEVNTELIGVGPSIVAKVIHDFAEFLGGLDGGAPVLGEKNWVRDTRKRHLREKVIGIRGRE